MPSRSRGGRTYLAHLVETRGLTPDGLVQRLREDSQDGGQPDSSLVWKWLNARVRPSKRYLQALAGILNVDVELLRTEIARDYTVFSRDTQAGSEHTALEDMANDIQFPSRDLTDQRVIIQASLVSSGARAMADLYESTQRNTLSASAIEGLVMTTEHLGRHFDDYGLVELRAQLEFQMAFVGKYLRESLTVGQRSTLVHNGARLAGMSASVAFLTGQVQNATLFDDIAFRLASEIADEGIKSWLRCEEAGMAAYARDPRRAIQLLQPALNVTDRAHRANVLTNLARAFGQLGDRVEVARSVVEAERLLLSMTDEQDSAVRGPHWSFSQLSGFTRIAESWLEVEMYAEAQEAANRALARSDGSSSPRLVGHARLALSAAKVGLGHLEAGCEEAADVFASGPQDFHTVAAHTRPLLSLLAPVRDSSPVARLRQEYDLYLHSFAI